MSYSTIQPRDTLRPDSVDTKRVVPLWWQTRVSSIVPRRASKSRLCPFRLILCGQIWMGLAYNVRWDAAPRGLMMHTRDWYCTCGKPADVHGSPVALHVMIYWDLTAWCGLYFANKKDWNPRSIQPPASHSNILWHMPKLQIKPAE